MEITFIQGILLAIMCIIVGLDFFLEAFFLFRPLMVSTFTGIILGDVVLGLKVGALIELAFAGLTPAGGTQPPNPVMAGLMGTVLAYTTGCEPEQALALCLPFSFLGQYIILFYYSAFSFFMGKADDCAANADIKGIAHINYLTMGIVSITYGVLAFLCAYVAQAPMQAFVEWLPEIVTHGLVNCRRYLTGCWFWYAASRYDESQIYSLFYRWFLNGMLYRYAKLVTGSLVRSDLCVDGLLWGKTA